MDRVTDLAEADAEALLCVQSSDNSYLGESDQPTSQKHWPMCLLLHLRVGDLEHCPSISNYNLSLEKDSE